MSYDDDAVNDDDDRPPVDLRAVCYNPKSITPSTEEKRKD